MKDLVNLIQNKTIVDTHALSKHLGLIHGAFKKRVVELVDENPAFQIIHGHKYLSGNNRVDTIKMHPNLYFAALVDTGNKLAMKLIYQIINDVNKLFEYAEIDIFFKIPDGKTEHSNSQILEKLNYIKIVCMENKLSSEFNSILAKPYASDPPALDVQK